MMVATAVASLVFAAAASMTIYCSRSFSSLLNYTDLDQYSRMAIDLLVRDIRSADALAYASGTNSANGQFTQLIFNTGGGSSNLSYTFDAATGGLWRTNGVPGAVGTLVTTNLIQCSALVFTTFSDRSAAGTFDQFPETNAPNVRLIKVDWNCTRTILGQKVNTESVQSAKIVLRRS
jgi:Tfp pilus assembly protein PilW